MQPRAISACPELVACLSRHVQLLTTEARSDTFLVARAITLPALRVPRVCHVNSRLSRPVCRAITVPLSDGSGGVSDFGHLGKDEGRLGLRAAADPPPP